MSCYTTYFLANNNARPHATCYTTQFLANNNARPYHVHYIFPCQQQCQTPCSMLCYTTWFLANNNARPHAACYVTPHRSLPTTMSILFSCSFLRFQLNWTGLGVEQTSLRPSEKPCKYTWAAPHTSGGVGGHPKASDSQPHSVHTAGGRRRKNVNSCLTGEFWGPLLNRKQIWVAVLEASCSKQTGYICHLLCYCNCSKATFITVIFHIQ